MGSHTGCDAIISTLRQEVTDLHAAVGRLRDVILAVEHRSGPYNNRCSWCDELYPEHFQTCERQDVLNSTQLFRFTGGEGE